MKFLKRVGFWGWLLYVIGIPLSIILAIFGKFMYAWIVSMIALMGLSYSYLELIMLSKKRGEVKWQM